MTAAAARPFREHPAARRMVAVAALAAAVAMPAPDGWRAAQAATAVAAGEAVATVPDLDRARLLPMESFLLARAAVEACRGRVLTTEERDRFLTALGYRDGRKRSREALAVEAESALAAFRDRIRVAGCDDPRVRAALFDWDLRVTAFARIEDDSGWFAAPAAAAGRDGV